MFPTSFRKIISQQQGFTLIEVMVALVIFVIAIIGCYRLQFASSFSNSRSYSVASASMWAQYMAEDLLSRQYKSYSTDPLLIDGTGDGIAGLNAATAATADGVRYVHPNSTIDAVAAGAVYSIYWNIVDNRPMPSVKQIHIIVVKNSGVNAGQLYTQDYFKL
jgi:prepilin-type N-terminal cleavage/methylation domain-containing protein